MTNGGAVMANRVLMVDARTYDRTGYMTSATRYTVVDNRSLAEEIAEDLAFECMEELNEEVRNSDLDDFIDIVGEIPVVLTTGG